MIRKSVKRFSEKIMLERETSVSPAISRVEVWGASLTDKVVVITGGSRGIGRAAAIAAAARGYRVVVGYATNKAAADDVVAQIEGKNGKAIAVKCDVAHESDILALFKAADGFGTLGALVNNAGIVGKSGVRVDEMSAERIQRDDGDQRHRQHLVRARGGEADVDQARRQGRRHRQHFLGRRQAWRAQHLCRLCRLQGRDRFLHGWPRP